MPSALHSKQSTADGIHTVIAYVYANSGARAGASGFTAEDVGKFAWQTDDNSIWMLTATTPSWVEVTATAVAATSNKILVSAKKSTAGSIVVGQVIKIVGYDGTVPLVELANASNYLNGPSAGIATQTISDSVAGDVMISGVLKNINTAGFPVGFGVYVGTTDGTYTPSPPVGPAFVQPIGATISAHATTGVLAINILSVRPLSNTAALALGAAAEGTSDFASRRDHVHSHGNQSGGSVHAVATTSVAGFQSGADKTKLDGVATGATATPLSSTSPVNVDKAAAAAGSSTSAARQDHKHSVNTGTPVAVGSANAEGSATALSRSDHIHSHGNQAGGALHANVIAAGASGFMTGADKTKLDGIAGGAGVYGSNYQYATAEASQSTTSTTYQNLVSLVTPALTGTYEVKWTCAAQGSSVSSHFEWRLFNSTDATNVDEYNYEPKDVSNWINIGGFRQIIFTGAAKTFIIQHRITSSGTVYTQNARISFHRVS